MLEASFSASLEKKFKVKKYRYCSVLEVVGSLAGNIVSLVPPTFKLNLFYFFTIAPQITCP